MRKEKFNETHGLPMMGGERQGGEPNRSRKLHAPGGGARDGRRPEELLADPRQG